MVHVPLAKYKKSPTQQTCKRGDNPFVSHITKIYGIWLMNVDDMSYPLGICYNAKCVVVRITNHYQKAKCTWSNHGFSGL